MFSNQFFRRLRRFNLVVLVLGPIGVAVAQDPQDDSETAIKKYREGILVIDAAPGTEVTVEQQRHEFWFGAALANQAFSGGMRPEDRDKYLGAFLTNFNAAVTENALKWHVMEPGRGQVNYRTVDAILAWTEEHQIPLRGHNIFWGIPNQVQDWLKDLPDDQLREALKTRALDIGRRYRDRFAEYDLNNEMVHGNYYEQRLGKDITLQMAQWVRQVDPKAVLFLNDYDILTGARLEDYIRQIRSLLDQGVPIGGIGVQGHLHADTFDPKALRNALERLSEFNRPIRVTEFNMPGQRSRFSKERSLRLTEVEEVAKARALDDNDLFAWLIARNPSDPQPACQKESHHRLKAAYDLAMGHVKNVVSTLEEKDHGDVLNTWVSFLEHKAAVVLVRVPSGSNAYKMFETLNDRGLRTSQADLIKNHLFGRSGGRFTEVQNRWSLMRGQLETLDESDITVTFLRQALITMHGFVREAEVYDTVTEKVKSEQTAVTFASSLETAATAYVAIFNPEHDKWNGYPDAARRSIEVLNLFDVKPLRPLLLAVAVRLKGPESAQALQFMVALSARLLITASTRTGSVEETIALVAHELFSKRITTFSQIKQGLATVTPKDQEFRLDFASARVSKAVFARYYLRSLEMAAKGEAEPWFRPMDDRSIINLEHVLPKKPEQNWPQFKPEEVEIYANRLGNQALLRATDNSALASDPFQKKKPVFANSPYILTSQIATFSDWTPEAIIKRQGSLADLALKAWPV